ncbi:MAG: glycosyltransferase family 2 protein [Bacteroidaceae bacterium]|nr:glycosyltransferase family 2 protein [Bacteroidaceae bacterium]
MKDLSVIIVSYNVRYYLEQCLYSVFSAEKELKLEVFVVDNNSTDDSVEYLSERFPQVRFIANEDNRGFSKANNQAIREAQGRYVLLLNPDTIVTEHTFTDCITYLDQHPEVGATGVSMYGADGIFAWESRRGVPTPWTAFCKMTGLAALFPHSRHFGRYHMRYLNREEANYIEVLSGAFFMMRAEVIQQVGMLDETFFMYGEDIDLSYRILQSGWKNAYVPTPIMHYKGESTQKSSYRYVQVFYEAMLIFFDKHFRHRYRFTAMLIHAAVYLRASLGILKRFGHRRLPAITKTSSTPECALCLGSAEALQQMHEVCRRNGITVVSEMEKNPLYIIFDTSTYSYGDILSNLIKNAKKRNHQFLGTYNPATGLMVLPNDIYQ